MEDYLIHDRLFYEHFSSQPEYVKATTHLVHQRLCEKMDLFGISREELEAPDFKEKFRVSKDLTFDPDTRVLVETYQLLDIELFVVKWTQQDFTILEHP